jgi:hypothetical protein
MGMTDELKGKRRSRGKAGGQSAPDRCAGPVSQFMSRDTPRLRCAVAAGLRRDGSVSAAEVEALEG